MARACLQTYPVHVQKSMTCDEKKIEELDSVMARPASLNRDLVQFSSALYFSNKCGL